MVEQKQHKKGEKNIAFQLLIAIIVSTFIIDTTILLILHSISHYWPALTMSLLSLINSIFLVIVMFPVLYLLFFRPMLLQIKERKQAEERLQKRTKELTESSNILKHVETELRKRTQKLEEVQDQLIRKEKLAAVGQLASGIGHELRNPLGVIGNSAYYLKMKLKDADKKVIKHLNILQREVQRSNVIITDLLDFSRSSPPSLRKADINNIVKNALANIKIEGITLETLLDENLPMTLADPDQIQQVFQNIISNAVQAMPEGGRLEIKTVTEDDFIGIIFKDTGEGIPEENFQKIFEPLVTTKAKGIGLGLAIVKGIVDRHQGGIEVESEVGTGTTFIVKLAIKDSKEEE